MKKIQTICFIAAAITVFVISFLVGKASALKQSAERKAENGSIYTGAVKIPESSDKPQTEVPASAEALNIPAHTEPTDDEPPLRMEFPCGEEVIKEYSEKDSLHPGIDYAAPQGSDVKAAWNGTVTRVYKDKIWGYSVVIDHGNGLCSVYKNLDKKGLIGQGQEVVSGQIIGKVGNSSKIERDADSHIHFELTQDGICINPESYIYAENGSIWNAEQEKAIPPQNFPYNIFTYSFEKL